MYKQKMYVCMYVCMYACTLLSDSLSSGQQQCHLVQTFLKWSIIEAKVVKCSSLAFRSRPSCTFYNPKLKLCGQDISFSGDISTTFLGLPIDLCLSYCDIKSSILTKLEDLCEKLMCSRFDKEQTTTVL